MRRVLLTISALAAIGLAPALFAGHANAMTNPLSAGIANAAQDVKAAEQIAYVCRRRCNWRGCFAAAAILLRSSSTGPIVVGAKA